MAVRVLLSRGSVIWRRGMKICAAKVPDNVTVRSASFKDLAVYRQICKEQGWILGKHDLELLFAADPTGYYIAELDGQAMSMFSAIKYGNVCCLGPYGVLQKFRNKGYALLFDQHARENVFETNAYASIFMTTDIEPFVLKNLSRYKVYRGWVEYEFTYEAKKAAGLSLPDPRTDIKLEPYQDTNFMKLFNYDSKIFGHPRRLFLKKLVSLSSCTSFIATTARSREIVGYCTIRETNDDDVCYLSPWYANDAEIAQQLLKKAALFACEHNPNVKFRSIMPDLNKDGLQIMHKLAPQVKDYKKLFVGKIPDSIKDNSKNRVFAISSPCLG